MKSSDRTILIGVGILALIGAFMVLVLMPKRNEASKLQEQVSSAQTAVDQAEQQLQVATEARKTFPSNYHRLVVLGKAVPSGDDTSSLLVQLGSVAKKTGVQFRGIELAKDGAGAPPPPPPAGNAATEAKPEGGESKDSSTATPVSQAAAVPTEAAAASLPIGATVGSAGLPVLPYKLSFVGDFFKVADFIDGIQDLVNPKADHVTVSGRLLTMDGFSLSRDNKVGFPKLKVSFAVTSYMTPAEEGLTAGASPTAPAPADDSPATTVSNPGVTP